MTRGTRFGPRYAFVLVQVAFSVLMLMGAGLFIRSLLTLNQADTGVRTHEILEMAFTPHCTEALNDTDEIVRQRTAAPRFRAA